MKWKILRCHKIQYFRFLRLLSNFWPVHAAKTIDIILISPNPANSIDSGVVQVPEWEKFEIGFKLPAVYNAAVNSFFTDYYSSSHIVNTSTDLNPYADDSLSVVINLTSPSGHHYRKWGFFMRVADFLVEADTGNDPEKLQLAANPSDPLYPYNWRFRFAPNELGSWSYSITISNPKGPAGLPTYTFNGFSFNCIAPLADNHGFLMINTNNKRSLQFTDGTPFFGIGENVAEPWHGSDPNDPFWSDNWNGFYKLDFDNYMKTLDEMSSVGANYLGKHTCKFDFSVEWYNLGVYDTTFSTIPQACCGTCYEKSRAPSSSKDTINRQYNFKAFSPSNITTESQTNSTYPLSPNVTTNRQYNLWAFDRFFDTLRAKNIYMQITVDPYPPIGTYGNWMWGDNAYVIYSNNANGKASPLKYYSDTTLRYYWKRRYKYIMDRWGYSVNLGVIESFGEVDQTLGFNTDSAKNVSQLCLVDSCLWQKNDSLRDSIYSWHTDIFGFLKDSLNAANPHLTAANFTAADVSGTDGNGIDSVTDYYRLLTNPKVDIADIHEYLWNTDNNQFGQVYTLSTSQINKILGHSVKPFQMGEFGTPGLVYGLANQPSTINYFNNYDISFHNQLWAGTFMGNITTGLSWFWQVTHWWPYANPNSLQYNLGTTTYNLPVDNVLGDINGTTLPYLYLPDGSRVQFKNTKIYYQFNRLSQFVQHINFSNITTAGNDVEDSVECYYLLSGGSPNGPGSVNNTMAYGWIHNMNKYWYNNYYYFYTSSPPYTFNYQRYNDCLAPVIPDSITISGLLPQTEYFIDFFYTSMGTVPSNFPQSQGIYTNSSGNLYIKDNILNYLLNTTNPCDSTNTDFAFVISLQSGDTHVRNNTNQNDSIVQVQQNVDYNVSVTPNPSNGRFSVLVQYSAIADAPVLFYVYDDIGKPIYTISGKNNSVTLIDLDNQPNGIFLLKTSVNNNNKYFKLIKQ